MAEHNFTDCRYGRLATCNGDCGYCRSRCLNYGGPGIWSEHACYCIREKQHPIDSPRPHRCGCGALWSINATPTVLLTGATGFVGRHILRQLLDRNCTVRATVRDPNKSIPGNVELIHVPNLFAEPIPQSMFDGVDIMIHAAWYAEPGKYVTSPLNLDCLTGTVNLARAFSRPGRRFIGVGTCAEYDSVEGRTTADAPLNPNTLYAACKAATFLALRSLFKEDDVSFAWCRIFYLYGDGEDERRLVPTLRRNLAAGQNVPLTAGTQIRDFLDVEWAAEMIVQTALGDHQGPTNICSGEGRSVRQLAETIADEYGRRDLLRFGERPEGGFEPPYIVGIPGPAESSLIPVLK